MFDFNSKGIVEAINKAANDIISNLNVVIGGETGSTAEGIMAGAASHVSKEMAKITEKYQNVGKNIGETLFNPLKVISKTTGKLMKKTFAGPKAQAMGGFMKNMGSMMGAMLGPIGIILSIFEKLGVFEPILEIVNDLIEMLGARILEKMMPSFEQLFDILLSDEVMTLIDSLADLFVAMIAPLMDIVITLLPVFIAILGPLIGLLAELMPLLMLPSMIIAKLIATLVELPGFQIVIEAIATVITLAAIAIGGFVDFVIGVINDIMNVITFGAWKDISTVSGEFGETTTTTGGPIYPTTTPTTPEGGTTINITVEGDISSEDKIGDIIDEISLRTKLGAFM